MSTDPWPTGAALIARERERQKTKGYTAEHDDQHDWMKLRLAGVAFRDEAAHAYLGHAGEDTNGTYRTHRGLAEVEAESASHVIAGLLGLDSSSWTVNYVAEWGHTLGVSLEETAARVLKTANGLYALISEGTPPSRLQWEVETSEPARISA